MRKLFYLAAALSLFAFIYSAVHVGQQLSDRPFGGLKSGKGFESVKNTAESDNLEDKFNAKIKAATDVASHDEQLFFWMSILVTGLTAASTLISGIQAAKKDTPDPGRAQTFAVIVAVLTFCSTMASTFSNHLNEVKTADIKTVTDLTTLREQFFTDYNKATDADKHAVVVMYKRKLG
jgi:hypothetical protein